MHTMEEITLWKGLKVVGDSDERIGTIDEIYVDEDTGKPEWLAVETGMFGSKLSLVPSTDARSDGNEVRIPFAKDLVKGSPNTDADGARSRRRRRRSCTRTTAMTTPSAAPTPGRRPATRRPMTAATVRRRPVWSAAARRVPRPTTRLTRSEQRMSVSTREVETGRVRLRKHVVTENVTTTVPVSREEVRIEREPITDANRDAAMAGGEITEEEHEVTSTPRSRRGEERGAQGARAPRQGHRDRGAPGQR